MKFNTAIIFLLASTSTAYTQNIVSDTTQVQLQPVEVKQYFRSQSLLKLTSSAQTVSAQTIQAQNTISLTSAINTVSGIRMEERSPGSYRLAMRGSLIRSPFGVRNTKVYMDEIPLTDAGGNTYINLLDPNAITAVQVIKGPDGSLFGANSGGVIRITPDGFDSNANRLNFQLSGGSFGLVQENFGISRNVNDKYNFAFNQSYTKSDGYRENSALNKLTLQTTHNWRYSNYGTLKFYGLYSDMNYQTPGGLTLKQYDENPKMARPAAGPNPGAAEQKATIYNKTFIGGLIHEYQLNAQLSHVISLFGSYTDFENPFITNYEFRKEKNLGTRTFLSYQNGNTKLPVQFQVGLEAIKGWNDIKNFDNERGLAGDPQAFDKLDNSQINVFTRAQIDFTSDWVLEASLGYNANAIDYATTFPTENSTEGSINFKGILSPRIATSYQFNNWMAVRGSISRGYSMPTIAEVRSSDNTINNNLLAESGVNYELGYKIKSPNNNWIIDLSIYQYLMENGIVRQINENGSESYVNAGEMNQKGAELSVWSFWKWNSNLLKSITFNTAFAYNHYRFGNYQSGEQNFKDNKITSVPDWTLVNTLLFSFAHNISLNIFHNHTSAIPLDDANTVFASAYDLIQAKVSWNNKISNSKFSYTLFAGSDNLLNQKYSLGNDINAFGGRYFNAAAPRNYYVGLKLHI